MKNLCLAAIVTASLANAANLRAQDYPSRPITVVIGLAAGGAVDLLMRTLAEHMRVTLGQPFVIENMGGAGGTIATGRVVRAAPDGYTLGMGSMGQYVVNGAVYNLNYDLLNDFDQVALLPSVPYWMVARKTMPAKDIGELIAWLKSNPDKATSAMVGATSVARLCSLFFQSKTGTSFRFIPYRGGAPALQDLVAGQIDLTCDLAANSLPQVRGGNIKAYAVMAKSRWFAAPDVPTADEAGVPGIYVTTWHGIWAPKGTPKPVIAKLTAAAQAAMADPGSRARLTEQGMDIPPREQQTPEGLGSVAKGRNREMVADHQGGRHQAGVTFGERLMRSLSFAFIVSLLAGLAHAQPYPSRPINIIVPFVAGGPVDTVARVVTDHMRSTLGQVFVVENVGGGGGTIASGRLVRAAPNGYTIGIGDVGTMVLNGAVYPLPYDLLTDFDPVALLVSSPLLVLSKTAVPARDLKELMAWLKANPDRVSQGHLGNGTLAHLCGLYMQTTTGAKWTFVPYRGAAPALQDLVGAQIDVMCAAPGGSSLPLVRSGQIKAYAIMAPTRLPSAPDIPTADEAGLPGFHLSFWQGLWAPKGTPKDIIERLNAAAVAALTDAGVQRKLADLGLVIPPRGEQTPEALGALRKAEADKWWPIIKAAGIKPE